MLTEEEAATALLVSIEASVWLRLLLSELGSVALKYAPCPLTPACQRSSMVVCSSVDPVEQRLGSGRRVLCWLYGPESAIPPGGTSPLEREAIAVADEA